MFSKKFHIALMLGAIAAAAGCAATSGPKDLDTSETAQLSYDGLYPVTNTRRNTKVWMREGFNLSGYHKIMVQGAGIEYRPTKRVSRASTTSSANEAYPISDKGKAEIRAAFTEAFSNELANVKGLELVSEPGPDVLIVRGYLLDVISKIPPQPIGGRSYLYLASVGEATLAIELIDSESDATLLRAVQRRNAETNTMNAPIWSAAVTGKSELEDLARDWAQLLRAELERLSATYNIGTGG